MADRIKVSVGSGEDIVVARGRARSLAAHLGFASGDRALLAGVVTELCRNILERAGRGEVLLGVASRGRTEGMVVVARDTGLSHGGRGQLPEGGWTVPRGGPNLSGIRGVVDELDIRSAAASGTTVTVTKWIS